DGSPPAGQRGGAPNAPGAIMLVAAPRLAGRVLEMTALQAALDDAVAGSGSTVLLTGEPGIGKTRIAEELTTGARARGAGVLWGRCWEGAPGTRGQSGAPPYWPWTQILRGAMRAFAPDTVAAVLGDRAGTIAGLVPEAAELLPDAAPPPALEPAQA